jgi:hypothetical protein
LPLLLLRLALGRGRKRRRDEGALREVVERAQVDLGILLADERRGDHEAERRQGDDAADERADAEGRALEEAGAGEALGHPRLFLGLLDDDRLRLGLGGDGTHLARGLADPEEAEDDRDDGADRGEPEIDDQPDEKEGDAGGEGEGPDRGGRKVEAGLLVLGAHPRPL